jgi:hypothetical protein
VSLEEGSTILLGVTTDLTNHDDTLGLRVLKELLKGVNEVGTVEGITTDTDDGGLTETDLGGLVDSLISEGTRAGDDTDLTGLVDVSGHDTDLTLVGLDDTGAVRTNEAGLGLLVEAVLDTDHVNLGDTLGNADNERDLSINSLEDSSGGTGRGDIDNSGVGTSLGSTLLNGVENGKTEVGLATLAGGDTTDHALSISIGSLDSVLGMEGTGLAGETLSHDTSILVNPNISYII